MIIDNKKFVCSLDYGMEIIRGKWKAVIICHLDKSATRFLELQRMLPGVSQKVLTEKLRELEKDGIVEKSIISELPLKVEYSLTESGSRLYEILRQLEMWSKDYINDFKRVEKINNNFSLEKEKNS